MADHALARWNAVGKDVLDRVSRFILGDRWIDVLDPIIFFGRGQPAIPVLGKWPRCHLGSVIGIHDMAGATATGAIVSRMVVGA